MSIKYKKMDRLLRKRFRKAKPYLIGLLLFVLGCIASPIIEQLAVSIFISRPKLEIEVCSPITEDQLLPAIVSVLGKATQIGDYGRISDKHQNTTLVYLKNSGNEDLTDIKISLNRDPNAHKKCRLEKNYSDCVRENYSLLGLDFRMILSTSSFLETRSEEAHNDIETLRIAELGRGEKILIYDFYSVPTNLGYEIKSGDLSLKGRSNIVCSFKNEEIFEENVVIQSITIGKNCQRYDDPKDYLVRGCYGETKNTTFSRF